MTEEMIKEIKHIQQCLINVDMEGEDYEEKMDAVHKLEDVDDISERCAGEGNRILIVNGDVHFLPKVYVPVHIIVCPHMCYASQRPEAPQGSTRPEEVTGRPIS